MKEKKNAKKNKKVVSVKVEKPKEKIYGSKSFISKLTLEQITMIGLGIIILLLIVIAVISSIKPTVKNGEEIVAKYTGGTITADELYKSLSSKYGRDLLIDTIDNAILNKLYKTTDDMESSVEATIKQYKSTYGDQFEAFLEYNGIYGGEDELKSLLIKNTKVSNVVDDYIEGIITKEEMKAYYEESIIGDIKASHILIKFTTTDSSTDEEVKADKARALAKAKSIIKELKAGAKFSTLAKKYSEDTSNASSGGDLGYFNTGDMEEAFEKAAIKLSVNSYTKTPVKTSYGYHIILKTGQKDKPSYEKSKQTIIEKLVAQYKANDDKMTYKALINMRKENKLNIYDSALKKAYDKYMNELLNSTTTAATTSVTTE